MQNVLLLAGLTCLIVKVVVQMTGAIPAFAASSYSIRLYIVAFIHLIMLGTVSATDSGLVRLGVPRRVYTQSHIDYLFSVFEDVMADKVHAKGFRLAYEPPFLRHFTARLERVR